MVLREICLGRGLTSIQQTCFVYPRCAGYQVQLRLGLGGTKSGFSGVSPKQVGPGMKTDAPQSCHCRVSLITTKGLHHCYVILTTITTISTVKTDHHRHQSHSSHHNHSPHHCCSYLVTQSCLTLGNPMDVAPQAALSMEFPRQEYWSELLFPSPGDLPDPGIKLRSPALQVDSLPLGKPVITITTQNHTHAFERG